MLLVMLVVMTVVVFGGTKKSQLLRADPSFPAKFVVPFFGL